MPKVSEEVTLVNNKQFAVVLWDITYFLKYQTSFWKHIATQFSLKLVLYFFLYKSQLGKNILAA